MEGNIWRQIFGQKIFWLGGQFRMLQDGEVLGLEEILFDGRKYTEFNNQGKRFPHIIPWKSP